MQTLSLRAPVEVFWNSFDFSQLLSWANLASRLHRPVRVHTSSGSLLIWSRDWKELLISSCASSGVSTLSGPVLVTLCISPIKALFPLLFEETLERVASAK